MRQERHGALSRCARLVATGVRARASTGAGCRANRTFAIDQPESDVMSNTPESLFPIRQESAEAAFDFVFAPWIKDMGLTDIIVREGYCSMRLPNSDKLRFSAGAVCGQALMAAIDTAAAMAVSTTDRIAKGTVYQHTHFLRPAKGGDFIIAAEVKRFGKSSAYIDCAVTFASSGELIAHGVLEFAF